MSPRGAIGQAGSPVLVVRNQRAREFNHTTEQASQDGDKHQTVQDTVSTCLDHTERIASLFFDFKTSWATLCKTCVSGEEASDDLVAKIQNDVQEFYRCAVMNCVVEDASHHVPLHGKSSLQTIIMSFMTLGLVLDTYAALVSLNKTTLTPRSPSETKLAHAANRACFQSYENSPPQQQNASASSMRAETTFGPRKPAMTRSSVSWDHSMSAQTSKRKACDASEDLAETNDGTARGGLRHSDNLQQETPSVQSPTEHVRRLKAVKSLATIDFHLTQLQSIKSAWTKLYIDSRGSLTGRAENMTSDPTTVNIKTKADGSLSNMLDTVGTELDQMREEIRLLMTTAKGM